MFLVFACGRVCIWMDFWAHRHFPTPFTPTLSLRQLLCLTPKGTHFPDTKSFSKDSSWFYWILIFLSFRFSLISPGVPRAVRLDSGRHLGTGATATFVSEENKEPPSCLLVGANKILPSPFLELFRTLVNKAVLGGVANSMACHW